LAPGGFFSSVSAEGIPLDNASLIEILADVPPEYGPEDFVVGSIVALLPGLVELVFLFLNSFARSSLLLVERMPLPKSFNDVKADDAAELIPVDTSDSVSPIESMTLMSSLLSTSPEEAGN
jgi:hypothetical protein